MKNVLFILLFLNFLTLLNGQTNRLFYKSVFKQADGTPIKNMDLNVLIKISNYNGLEKYSECHLIRTDQNGYGYLWLGFGDDKSGKLGSINFESEKHILKILLKDFQVYRWSDIYCTPFSKYPNLPESLHPSNIIKESNIFYWGGIKLKALGIGYNNEVLSIEHDDNIDDKAYNDEIKAGKSFVEKLSDEEVIIKSSTVLKNYLQKGFVFDLLPQPNLLYSKSISIPNSDINTFQSKIGNLEFNKIYYIRSYITYENDTIYGETAKFQIDKKINVQLPCPNVPKIFDIDGNSYNTVQIGNQCWTKENLKVTKFKDGSLIQIDESGGVTGSTTGQTWTSQTIGKRTIYANDKTKLSVYGYLYNWFVVSDSRGICPSGWHVPEREELSLLINFLGGEKTAGSKLKEKSSTLWQNSNLENSNESGFSGIPAGIRGTIQGGYSGIGSKGVWWSSTKYDKDDAYKMELTNNSNDAKVGVTSMLNGFSIRCVKDNLKNSNDSIPKISTIQITDVTSNSAQSGGSISSVGGSEIIAKGVVWSRSKRPDILTDSTTREGKGIGTFSSALSGLISGKKYYVRAYATSKYGTSYGQELSFKTLISDKLPKVETSIINDITQKSAISGGKILNDGDLDIITKGVVWSKNLNPKLWLFANKTKDGIGNENFISIIDKLSPFETYYVRAYATNSAGTGYGNELTFKTTAAAVVPTLTTAPVSSITSKTAVGGGNISSDGGSNVTARGVVWSTSPNPTVSLTTKTTNGSGIGTFASDMIDLVANTTYYVRAYATNSAGTGYGNELTFKTTAAAVVPSLSTELVSSITSKTAVSGGNISSDGGSNVTIRGVVWSTNPNPTVTLTTKTINGNGIGTFASDMVDLLANTTYYVRAYATNSAGTGYGNELTFKTTTAAIVPTLTTTQVIAITSKSAVSGGNISSDGGLNVTARGVVWSTNPNPTVSLTTKTTNGNGIGTFTSDMINLLENTTYYVRAYATNTAGTGYGNEISLRTLVANNEKGQPCSDIPSYKDIDGNTYNTVQIGTQCWTKENLRVSKYKDGTLIPFDESGGTTGDSLNETWSERITGARAVYGKNTQNIVTYGYLYNWYTVENPKGLCPSGWHVPSRSEFDKLITFLGGEEIAGGKMKSTGTTFWKTPNEGATNESGFFGLPGGYRDRRGKYEGISLFGAYWSSTNIDINDPEVWLLSIGSENRLVGWTDVETLEMGASIRCLKDTIINNTTSLPTLTTTSVSTITSTSANTGGNITNDGGASITARGVVWSTNPNPTIALSTKTTQGTGIGTFTSILSNLTINTTYYVRAYATNSAGTGYGNELTFKTTTAAVVPTLITTPVTSITSKTAVSGGNISSDGGSNVTIRGVVWSTNTNPTVSLTTKTTNGNGIGTFASDMVDLLVNTTYYVRAYATNSAGTGYGNELTFKTTTEEVIPLITTIAVNSITSNSAISGGYISEKFNSSIVERGIVWSKDPSPIVSVSSKTSDGSELGEFRSYISNLTYNTTYYVRAYLITSEGTFYGNELIFSTKEVKILNGRSCEGTTTIKDIDGNLYNTVQIGTQCWLRENLKVSKYNDGTDIPLDASGGKTGLENQKWTQFTTGARTVNEHDSLNLLWFGYLYNWYAVRGIAAKESTNYKNLCPEGWHVPSYTDWTILFDYLGGQNNQSGKMMSTNGIAWEDAYSYSATNESGFSAFPGGFRGENGIFQEIYYGRTIFWSSTNNENETGLAYGLLLPTMEYPIESYEKYMGSYIRCINDNNTTNIPLISTIEINSINSNSAIAVGNINSDRGIPISSKGFVWSNKPLPTVEIISKSLAEGGLGSFKSTINNLSPNTTYYLRAYATNNFGTGYGNEINFTTPRAIVSTCEGLPIVKDIDENIYNTVKIGNQCWTRENLKTTKYNDGTTIPLDTSGGINGDSTGQTWSDFVTGARTVYGHDSKNLSTYGYLYNGYAASGIATRESTNFKNLCPEGWHVPSNLDWKILSDYLGGEEIAGGKMKSTGTTFWESPNEGATNESGFSGLPGGFRNVAFIGVKYGAYFYSSSKFSDYYANYDDKRSIVYELTTKDSSIIEDVPYLSNGHSIRCVRNNNIGFIPNVITKVVEAVSSNSATSGGYIISDGGLPILVSGVVWSTNSNPTVSLSTKTINVSNAGSPYVPNGNIGIFNSEMINLLPNTIYYVRAYATNSAGTSYGNDISFSIIELPKTGLPCEGLPIVKDIDGNIYNTVKIGNQCWTRENLRTTKYSDGTTIPLDISGGINGNGTSQTWSDFVTGARTVYEHDSKNLTTYGHLYNWYAARGIAIRESTNLKNLCPEGWHVPSDTDWKKLSDYLGGENIAGGKMKSINSSFWRDEDDVLKNIGATNESGFSSIPSGIRDGDDGEFNAKGIDSEIWSSTERNDNLPISYRLVNKYIALIKTFESKNQGLAIRCIKN